jgi:hypothetical protein
MRKLNVVLVVLLSMAGWAQSKGKVQRQTFTVDTPMFVSCVNGNVGEIVDVKGTLNYIFVWNKVGTSTDWTVTGIEQSHPRLVGIGETTGIHYRSIGTTRFNFVTHSPSIINDHIDNIQMVGNGEAFRLNNNVKFAISLDSTMLLLLVEGVYPNCSCRYQP